MKPLNRKNYGSIPHLSNSKLGSGDYFITEGQEKILTANKRDKHDEIFVFEKYDGSNVGIAKKNGKIFPITRSGYIANTSPYEQHHLFYKWVLDRVDSFNDILKDGERLAGEWLIQAHGLKYEINQEPIVFFDHFDSSNKRKSFDELSSLGVELPRLLHRGDAIQVCELIDVLNQKTDAIKSDEFPEGMVYRVERKGVVDFLAKWVRPDFKTGQYIIDVEDVTMNKLIHPW